MNAVTPNEGKSEDVLDIEYSADELDIAFNYKYVLDGLKNMDSKNIEIYNNIIYTSINIKINYILTKFYKISKRCRISIPIATSIVFQ